MNEPAMLADHLDNQIDAIIELWRSVVSRVGDVPEPKSLTPSDFVDHIPELLERLADRLRGHATSATVEGRLHGGLRWRQGYDIAQVVHELGHLRTVLIQATFSYAEQQGFDIATLETVWEAINDVLNQATAEAVAQFQRTSDAQTRQALAQVADRQRALEKALRTAEAERATLRTLLSNLPVAVWVADAEGTIVTVNHEAEQLQGFGAERTIGRVNVFRLGPEYQLFHPDGRPVQADESPLARALRGEVVWQEEIVWPLQGRHRVVTVNAAPLTDATGAITGGVAVLQDITPRIDLERELQRQRERAEHASQHKSQLLSALSHDARTPLSAVVLSVDLLEMHLHNVEDPEVRESLRTIRHAVRNVLDLLGDLLNLTKIDAGALPAKVSRFPLDPMLDECLGSIETQARLKGLDVRLEPGPLAGTVLQTDRAKLKQILCNFLSNALRYTERGHIRLACTRTQDRLQFAVEDTGFGIHPEDQSRIFEEFAVLSHPRRPIGEGTGLGLAICRRLATLLDGTITLRSAPGQGSTFTLSLPASILTSEPSPEGEDEVAAPPPLTGAILIVEDHPTSRQTLAKVLRRMGYHVLEANNGRDALTLIRRHRPRAVLMDVNMPDMDGVEATRALRADPQTADLPIFILTGDVSPINQKRVGEAGVNGYLEKPVTWEALKQALESIPRPLQ